MRGDTPLENALLFSVAYVTEVDENSPAQYTLKEAWESSIGRLVFLGEAIDNAKTFKSRLKLLDLTASHRLIWIVNPNDPAQNWTYSAFRLSTAEAGVRKLVGNVSLPFSKDTSGYFAKIETGSLLSLDADTQTINIKQTGKKISFGRDLQALPLTSSFLKLKMDGLNGATLIFDFVFPGGEELVTWLDKFDVGLRYSYQKTAARLGSIRFPIFSGHKLLDGFTAKAHITPANLLIPSASFIELSRSDQQNDILISFFRTVTGRTTTLGLENRTLKLYFAQCSDTAHTLIPDGRFKVKISDQLQHQVLGDAAPVLIDDPFYEFAFGGAGTEYIRIPEIAKNHLFLEFHAGYPAHVLGGDDGDASLDDRTKTSWVRFTWDTGADVTFLEYCAQPTGQATLYVATAPAGSAKIPLLPYHPMVAGHIGSGDAAPILPWVPMAGISSPDRDTAINIESTAIAPARKEVFSKAEYETYLATGTVQSGLPDDTVFTAGEKLTAITPNGLEAHFLNTEGGEIWESLQIARLISADTGANINSGELKFANGSEGIVEPLKSALLASQQFLVITDAEKIKPFFSGKDATVQLKGWKFLLDPDGWATHETIMIVKNATTPLGELAGDTGAWTSGDVFNGNVGHVSKTLKAIIADAEQQLESLRGKRAAMPGAAMGKVSDLEYFVDTVVRSPDWNGFLFLNAKLGDPPNELEGLRGGIVPGQLYAHHLGVTQTPFDNLEKLQSRSSSMFGLIRYADQQPAFGQSSTYDFRVNELGVLFQDSEVRDFRAFIDIHLAKLFNQYAVNDDGSPAIARLEGVLLRRDGGDAYMFTSPQKNEFNLGGGILAAIEIVQGEFETVSVDKEITGQTHTRFLFAGSLKFTETEGFDLFSFDNLAFSDLALNMSFKNDQPLTLTFEFTTENTILDEALSEVRDDSLYRGFPARLGHFVYSESDLPAALGYMTVQLPELPDKLPANWYGLSLKLDMGTLSDAAGSAGIEANLLLAWGTNKKQFSVGLEIKGYGLSGSSDELSLLGVLKLKMYSLSLRKGKTKDDKAWALLMHGMKLGIFSKSLPPNGSFDFYLFGNPDPGGNSNSFGWYGAYVEEKKDPPAKSNSLVSGDAPPAAQYHAGHKDKINSNDETKIIVTDNNIPPTIRRRGRRNKTGELL